MRPSFFLYSWELEKRKTLEKLRIKCVLGCFAMIMDDLLIYRRIQLLISTLWNIYPGVRMN